MTKSDKLRSVEAVQNRFSALFEKLSYSTAKTADEREAVYRLRYKRYLETGMIDAHAGKRISDAFDETDNARIVTIHYEDTLVASFRIHVSTPENPATPSAKVFPDVLEPRIERGETIIDPTRFVAEESASQRIPGLVFLVVRLAPMAAIHFDADFCLASVQPNHVGFYKRVFQSRPLCEPRSYPGLNGPVCLMGGEVPALREKVIANHPYFASQGDEALRIFGHPKFVSASKPVPERAFRALQRSDFSQRPSVAAPMA